MLHHTGAPNDLLTYPSSNSCPLHIRLKGAGLRLLPLQYNNFPWLPRGCLFQRRSIAGSIEPFMIRHVQSALSTLV